MVKPNLQLISHDPIDHPRPRRSIEVTSGVMRTKSRPRPSLIPLLEARSLLQEQLGTSVTDATIRNWSSVGVRGFVLPSFLVGGRRFTTEAAITGFLRELNGGAGLDSVLLVSSVPPYTGGGLQSRRA